MDNIQNPPTPGTSDDSNEHFLPGVLGMVDSVLTSSNKEEEPKDKDQ